MQLIILAAGMGTRLMPITKDLPKCLVPINGKSILQWQINIARSIGIDNIVVITGFQNEAINLPEITTVHNHEFASSNMVYSLFCAEEIMETEFIVSYGDILYSPDVLEKLIESKQPISVVVDDGWQEYWRERFENPLDDAESLKINNGKIYSIGQKPNDINEIESQYIGLIHVKSSGKTKLVNAYKTLYEVDQYQAKHMYMTDLLQILTQDPVGISPIHINRNWLEIDSLNDLKIAEKYFDSVITNEKSL